MLVVSFYNDNTFHLSYDIGRWEVEDMEDFKLKIKELLDLKYEHIEDIIAITSKQRDEFSNQLKERLANGEGNDGNLYLEGIVTGMDGVINSLKKYVED